MKTNTKIIIPFNDVSKNIVFALNNFEGQSAVFCNLNSLFFNILNSLFVEGNLQNTQHFYELIKNIKSFKTHPFLPFLTNYFLDLPNSRYIIGKVKKEAKLYSKYPLLPLIYKILKIDSPKQDENSSLILFNLKETLKGEDEKQLLAYGKAGYYIAYIRLAYLQFSKANIKGLLSYLRMAYSWSSNFDFYIGEHLFALSKETQNKDFSSLLLIKAIEFNNNNALMMHINNLKRGNDENKNILLLHYLTLAVDHKLIKKSVLTSFVKDTFKIDNIDDLI